MTGVLMRRGRDIKNMHSWEKTTWGHAIIQPSASQERGLGRNQTFWHLDCVLPASRTEKHKFLLDKPLSLWYIYGSPSRIIHQVKKASEKPPGARYRPSGAYGTHVLSSGCCFEKSKSSSELAGQRQKVWCSQQKARLLPMEQGCVFPVVIMWVPQKQPAWAGGGEV